MNNKILARVAFRFLKDKGLLYQYLKHNHVGIKRQCDLAWWMGTNQGYESQFIFFTINWDETPRYADFSRARLEFAKEMEGLYRNSPEMIKKLAKAKEEI